MIPLLDASADVMTPRGRILSQQTKRKEKAKGPTPNAGGGLHAEARKGAKG